MPYCTPAPALVAVMVAVARSALKWVIPTRPETSLELRLDVALMLKTSIFLKVAAGRAAADVLVKVKVSVPPAPSSVSAACSVAVVAVMVSFSRTGHRIGAGGQRQAQGRRRGRR